LAEKDLKEKVLEDYNDVFADIYNTLVFEGNYLREDGLSGGATTSIYKTEIGEPAEQFRDVLKTYSGANLSLMSLGIETSPTKMQRCLSASWDTTTEPTAEW